MSLWNLSWLPGDPLGTGAREQANKAGKHARGQADQLLENARSGVSIDPNTGETIMRGNQIDPDSMQRYDGTPMQYAEGQVLTDDTSLGYDLATDSVAEGMGPSAFEGQSSAYGSLPGDAYDELGSSAWRGDLSAWSGTRSNFGDLGYSDDALSGMGESRDYYGNLMEGGTDAQAEADYARRREQAERRRGANTQAALAGLEAKGQGGAGNALLAQLSNQQASASDQYQAGLDANAIAQARRDSAAGSYGTTSERMGNAQLTADQARAQGLDTYQSNRNAGKDSFGAQQNAGLDQYAQQNAQGSNEYQLAQAGGQDAFGLGQAAGQDSYETNRAGMQDEFNIAQREQAGDVLENNAERRQESNAFNAEMNNNVRNMNTKQENDISYYNQVTAPQQQMNNVMGATGLATGAGFGYAGQMNSAADNAFGPMVGNTVASIYTMGQNKKKQDTDTKNNNAY